MTITNLTTTIDPNAIGEQIYSLMKELFPICRSITGNGVRETLKIIGKHIPLEIHEVPSGTEVFDWTIPKEWNIRDAYVKDSKGARVIDFKQSNLHVVSYSVPVNKKMAREELLSHIFTIPEEPELIPFRNSFYKEDWGFCIEHKRLCDLNDHEYDVCIDSTLEDGFMTFGEFFLQGRTDDEIVIFTHTCHPSLCNDNLTGISVATFLAEWVRASSRHYSYRFLFCPTTIGSITWLALNEPQLYKVKSGLILTGLGDSGGFTYKKSRKGDSMIDRTVAQVLCALGKPFEIYEFSPFGYDERQFCSPGFNLPFGCLMRTPNGKYPEYHSSGDGLGFISQKNLAESLKTCINIIESLENNRCYFNTNPKGEPQLGRRGLFRAAGRKHQPPEEQFAILWVLNLSDGFHSILDIVERSGLKLELVKRAADILITCGLLQESPDNDTSKI
jgi:aminopeptidase-like protein